MLSIMLSAGFTCRVMEEKFEISGKWGINFL